MIPKNVCPIMSGQFITAAQPIPTVYYQQCIKGDCQIWDVRRSTCGLKINELNSESKNGIPISACEKICEWCNLKKAAPTECDPCRINDILKAYYGMEN